jgi:hypothetical protein
VDDVAQVAEQLAQHVLVIHLGQVAHIQLAVVAQLLAVGAAWAAAAAAAAAAASQVTCAQHTCGEPQGLLLLHSKPSCVRLSGSPSKWGLKAGAAHRPGLHRYIGVPCLLC